MSIFKYLFPVLFFITAFQCKSQVTLGEINFDKIAQKKVREFLIGQLNNQINSLTDIEPSINNDSKTEGYKTLVNEYFVKDSLSKVWRHYVNTNPGDSWSGRKVSFGMLFSIKDKRIVYSDESVSHIEAGQVVYLNLKLMEGIVNLATVFEFTNINKEKRIIEFCYIDGNITEGKQRIQFTQTPRGYTHIIHTSYYKSNSAFRDRFLYPFFHNKLCNEFHRNMKKLYYKKQLSKRF